MEDTEVTNIQRKRRKEDAKMQKKQRIVESGGTWPRSMPSNERSSNFRQTAPPELARRFGRVMEQAPCRNVPRFSTVSIAIPGSIVTNCQTKELQTILCGQIARMATIYHVDEIIVYNDQLSHTRPQSSDRPRNRPPRESDNGGNKNQEEVHHSANDPQVFMGRILQYCECPQYLRRHFFPLHADLQYTGLLPPMDAPHHVRAQDRSPYREGVVLSQLPPNSGSLVNCGIRNRPVHIDQRLQPGIRCTIQIDPAAYGRPGTIHGKVVSPSTIPHSDGTYWGYTVRIAASLKSALEDCPYADGSYDLTIGTSERGNESIDDPNFSLQQRFIHKSSGTYRHALIVFGGVAGIEECIDADESIQLSGAKSSTLFDKWINICPYQGSRTIRTEEAVSIALAKLSPYLLKSAQTKQCKGNFPSDSMENAALALPDEEELSDESSDEDGS